MLVTLTLRISRKKNLAFGPDYEAHLEVMIAERYFVRRLEIKLSTNRWLREYRSTFVWFSKPYSGVKGREILSTIRSSSP